MTELSGTLEGVGLPAIIRLLTGLKKTGCLRIVHDDWQGEIVFNLGQITDASLGLRHGLPALDGLVQALPGGSFTFDASAVSAAATTIDLGPDALQAHLDALVAGIVGGTPRLPSVDSVPELVVQDESGAGEEPLPLGRGTLQTLLAVDGRRTVREIVAQRGSFDALWQLGNLAEIGLVRLTSSAAMRTGPRAVSAMPASVVKPAVPPAAPAGVPHSLTEVARAEPQPEATDHCPKLGFEDDPANSFGRPTRLHRCFAAATPLSLSLDQQRELCLSDQFGTCPRLTEIGRRPARPSAREPLKPTPAKGVAPVRGLAGNVAPVPVEPDVDDPRIVPLPFAGRRTGMGERQTGSAAEPTQLRSSGFGQRNADPTRPTPLRARIDRANSAAFAPPKIEREAAPTVESRPAAAVSARVLIEEPSPPRFGTARARLIAAAAVVGALLVLGLIAFLVVPHLGEWFGDDNADLASMPNASAVAAGTPVAEIAGRLTPAPTLPSLPGSATSASAASAASAPAAPTLAPEAAPATAEPTIASQPPTPLPASQPAIAPLLDDRFVNNVNNWPSNAQGTAWLTSGSYRLIPRQAGQFVAIGAPLANVVQDVIVSATFRKLAGTPAGGGFGIIVRDASPAPLDGANQGGQYYVLEVGDKGEVGIWRRDADRWVDLLPWQHADAVRPGTATNDLVVSAIGNRLSMTVNGTPVVTRTDNALTGGRVGMLAGGDGNQVAVDHYIVQTP